MWSVIHVQDTKVLMIYNSLSLFVQITGNILFLDAVSVNIPVSSSFRGETLLGLKRGGSERRAADAGRGIVLTTAGRRRWGERGGRDGQDHSSISPASPVVPPWEKSGARGVYLSAG